MTFSLKSSISDEIIPCVIFEAIETQTPLNSLCSINPHTLKIDVLLLILVLTIDQSYNLIINSMF